MLRPYLPFLLLLLFVVANAAGMIGLSHLVGPKRPTPLKDAPYESGMPPLGSAHERFSVKFYLVAYLVIVVYIAKVFRISCVTSYFCWAGGVLHLASPWF